MNDQTETEVKDDAVGRSDSNVGLGKLPFFMKDANSVCDEFNSICADLVIHGRLITISGYRRWYNPMRYIKGDRYINRINPKYLYA